MVIVTKEFIFETFDEAMNVHKKLFEMLRENGVIPYVDLYSLVYKDDVINHPLYCNIGWTNIWCAKVEPLNDEDCRWVLRMPEIEDIKNIKKKEK